MATISAFVPCLEGTSTPTPLRRYRTLPSATYFMNDGHLKTAESKASERTRGGRSVNTNKGIVRSFRRVFSDDSYPTSPIPANIADVSDQRPNHNRNRPCLRLWVTPRQTHQSSTTKPQAPDALPSSREPTPGPSPTPPRRSSLMRAKAVIGLAPTPSRVAARHRPPYPLIGVGHPSAGVVTQPNSPSIPEPLPGFPPPCASSRIATPSPLSTAKSEEMELDPPTALAHPCVAEAKAAGVKVRDFAFEPHSITPAPIVEPVMERPGIPARWSKVNSLLDAKWDLPVMTQSQPCPFSDSLVDDWPETSASQPVEGPLSRQDSDQFSQVRAMSVDSQLPNPEVVSFDHPPLPTGPRRSNRLRNLDTFSAGDSSPTEPSAKRRKTSSRAKSAPLESRAASKRPHRADGRKRRRAGPA